MSNKEYLKTKRYNEDNKYKEKTIDKQTNSEKKSNERPHEKYNHNKHDNKTYTIQYTSAFSKQDLLLKESSSDNESVDHKLKGKAKVDRKQYSDKKKTLIDLEEITDSDVDNKNKDKDKDKVLNKNTTKLAIGNLSTEFIENNDYITFPSTTKFLSKDQSQYILKDKKVIPWMTKEIKSEFGHLKLHYEIKAFYEFIKPTEEENALRDKSFSMVKSAILQNEPNWKVKPFGSFTTNLHLPDSDIDVIVLQDIDGKYKYSEDQMLNKIKTYLQEKNLVSYIQIIKSKVPIIKACLKETNINIDICVNRKNGYQAQKDINLILKNSPYLREIIYVLKYFLRQRQVNEAYSGGISSFLLFNLVYAYSSYFFKVTTLEQKQITLSHLLTGFFNFYGFEMNYDKVAISIRNGGYFFLRKESKFSTDRLLCVENYQDTTQDIGRSCFKFPSIISLFKKARDDLYFPDMIEDSFLEKIILIDNFIMERHKQKSIINLD